MRTRVCEIVSSATARLDRAKKVPVYAREGIAHCWLVDPLACTIEVLRLESGRWTLAATHEGHDVIRAEPFDEIDIELTLLWEEPARVEPAP